MKNLTLPSPAKLNLFLKVVKKRPDGYHELVTLFERISLHDTLKFTLRQDGAIRIICRHPDVPIGPKNLVFRVAWMLQKEHDIAQGISVEIIKRIPVAAGLAGGSSNAATTLKALNKLWKLNLSQKQLVAYGRKIGADVPFFLNDCSWAVGTQRGDRIRPVRLRAKLWHVVAVPRVKLYTKDVFENISSLKGQKQLKYKLLSDSRAGRKGPALTSTNLLTKPNDNVNILIHHLRKNDFVRVATGLRNDLEESAFSLLPRLKILKELFGRSNTLGVSLSGSGPSIFGLIRSRKEANKLQQILSKHYRQVFVVSTY